MTDTIEDGSIFLEVSSQDTFVYVGFNYMKLVSFDCELLTSDILHDLLHNTCLFSSNSDNLNIVSFSFMCVNRSLNLAT